jgi:hypothetical protein
MSFFALSGQGGQGAVKAKNGLALTTQTLCLQGLWGVVKVVKAKSRVRIRTYARAYITYLYIIFTLTTLTTKKKNIKNNQLKAKRWSRLLLFLP